MKKIVSFLCLGLAAVGCQPTLVAEFQDKAVVEGYLVSGAPPTFTVSKLIALRSDVAFSDEDVNALSPVIRDEDTGIDYLLLPQGDGSYTNTEMIAAEGHTYSLSLPYNGEVVTASTVIPDKPQDMALSATYIEVPSFQPMGMAVARTKAFGSEPVEVTWSNPNGDYYMLLVECTEANPRSIYNFDDDEERPDFRFRTEPTTSASSQLSMQSFSYYGYHNVILLRMQPEYALLYQSTSNTISEIHANVEGGYGIFTGMSSDTLRIRVITATM